MDESILHSIPRIVGYKFIKKTNVIRVPVKLNVLKIYRFGILFEHAIFVQIVIPAHLLCVPIENYMLNTQAKNNNFTVLNQKLTVVFPENIKKTTTRSINRLIVQFYIRKQFFRTGLPLFQTNRDITLEFLVLYIYILKTLTTVNKI